MIRLITAAVAASTLTAAPALVAAEIEIESDGPVVELSISESVSLDPDIATIFAGVEVEAPTAVEAMRMNAAEMRKVIDRIKTLGIDEKDIQTTRVSLNARFDYDDETRERSFRGYQAANMVSVKLRDVDATSGVLDALVVAGANDISGPIFSVEDTAAAKAKARESAVKLGQERAEAYARMLGYEEVRVLEINENIRSSGFVESRTLGLFESAANIDAPPIEPGQVSTGVSITIKYEMVSDEEESDDG